jgi:pyruvate dehydrogenase E2 component (dihydrolipoamide acetyltransferase)
VALDTGFMVLLSLRPTGTTGQPGSDQPVVERDRAGLLTPAEVSCGTFTVTNLGNYDIDAFTPIINPPEAAILGVGRIVEKVVIHQGKIAQRMRLTLSLTFDHRLVDGAPAAAFLQTVKQLLEAPEPLKS